jgi:hypothetical protein
VNFKDVNSSTQNTNKSLVQPTQDTSQSQNLQANTNPPPSEEVKQDLSQSTPSKQQNIDSSASKSQAAIKSTTITISSSTTKPR